MNISWLIHKLRKGTPREVEGIRMIVADELEELDERVAIMEEGCGLRTEEGFTEYLPEQTHIHIEGDGTLAELQKLYTRQS